MNEVALIDGSIVPSDSPAWRDECAQRHRHVQNLLGLAAKHDRQAYLWNLANREGPEATERVRAQFLAAWDARKAAA